MVAPAPHLQILVQPVDEGDGLRRDEAALREGRQPDDPIFKVQGQFVAVPEVVRPNRLIGNVRMRLDLRQQAICVSPSAARKLTAWRSLATTRASW